MRWQRVMLVAVVAAAPMEARAQWTVFDPSNYAENVAQYLRALDQLRLTQAEIDNQLQALRKLGRPEWRRIAGVVDASAAAAGRPGAIAYTAGDLDRRFQSAFPGAAATRAYPTDERAQAAQTLATLAGVLDATRAGAATFAPGMAQLDRIKSQVGAARGHEETLELAATVHVYTAEELVLLRQAIAAQTNAQAVYFASQVSGDAQAQENARALWAGMSADGPRRARLNFAGGHR